MANAEENYLKETSLILTTSYLDNHTNVASVNLLDMLDEDRNPVDGTFPKLDASQ